ncbi:Octanoyltransferase LipM [Sporomusa ovata DSM 2662]|uniref:Lipoate-protein ligase A n=1 Tax=Sporomusa ovata TaxID=2378 RepID=A0A0U1KY39_9FIRM|nr:biotin/lipoate A/B protein ligase family protein [Sporomusa ovata]EQB28863.1 octanoyltransferase LipM [Sporomusa ovata DSM 2662]CQR72286.1 Lipoate-protein ligase A [Sporomusa ovata]
MKWRVVNTGIDHAANNMAIDEAILRAHISDEAPPTIRFYGWKPAAMSIGYFQKATDEINIEKCRIAGIDVVRRLTGGRAVLHDAELTYSVVVRENYPQIPSTITASYCYFSKGLLAGLNKLGIDANMSIPRAAYGQTRRRHASAACFDAPSHYEITAQGRKLAGSSQVRKEGVILQHGSLLLAFDPVKIASLLNLPSLERQNMVAEMLSKRAVSIKEIVDKEITWESACQVMTEAFGAALGIELEPGQLSEKEQAIASELTDTKYSCDSWNLLR